MELAEHYERLRPRAFAIAYRMLGTVGDAEDVVQEAFLRLHRELESGERIASPEAYVATVVTRLAIDELRSARARRERYVGEWLPEPLVTDSEHAADPALAAERAETLSVALLVVLESLSPEQRAAFLLREVFDYPYDEVARIAGGSEANARQLVSRARRHVDERRPRFESSREQHERLADRFLAALERGELGALESMLAADVALHGDGGGKVPALARAVRGRARVARTLAAWSGALDGVTIRRVELNGAPGVLTLDREGRVIGAISIAVAGGEIVRVSSVVNPEKLRHLGPVADLGVLLRERSAQRGRGRDG